MGIVIRFCNLQEEGKHGSTPFPSESIRAGQRWFNYCSPCDSIDSPTVTIGAPAKTLILEQISSRNPTVIAENYFSSIRISRVFADAHHDRQLFFSSSLSQITATQGWFSGKRHRIRSVEPEESGKNLTIPVTTSAYTLHPKSLSMSI